VFFHKRKEEEEKLMQKEKAIKKARLSPLPILVEQMDEARKSEGEESKWKAKDWADLIPRSPRKPGKKGEPLGGRKGSGGPNLMP